MDPKTTISAFDVFLERRGLRLDAVVVGGAALNLLGIISRATKDFDILHPSLSAAVAQAAQDFAASVRAQGNALDNDWLNNGPAQVAALLPAAWQQRLQLAYSGRALVLHTLGRSDLLKTKLFAHCDRGTDLRDCIALAPSVAELREALPWVQGQDANPDWPAHVESTFADLSKRLGHDVS